MTFIPSFTFTNAPTALVAMNARPVVRARNGCTVRIYVTVSMRLEVVSARKRGTPPVFFLLPNTSQRLLRRFTSILAFINFWRK